MDSIFGFLGAPCVESEEVYDDFSSMFVPEDPSLERCAPLLEESSVWKMAGKSLVLGHGSLVANSVSGAASTLAPAPTVTPAPTLVPVCAPFPPLAIAHASPRTLSHTLPIIGSARASPGRAPASDSAPAGAPAPPPSATFSGPTPDPPPPDVFRARRSSGFGFGGAKHGPPPHPKSSRHRSTPFLGFLRSSHSRHAAPPPRPQTSLHLSAAPPQECD